MSQASARLVILSPVAEAAGTAAAGRSERSFGQRIRVGLLSNGKPNTDRLLDGLLEVLGGDARFAAAARERKASASEPADEAILARLSSAADLVVGATAD